MMRGILLVVLAVAVAAAGCGALRGETIQTGQLLLPDGSLEANTATHMEAGGLQTFEGRSYRCVPDKVDADGRILWKDCVLQTQSNYGGDTPGMALGKAILNNAAAGIAIGGGIAGAGALTRPSTVTQTGGRAAAGSVTTGTVGTSATVTNTVSP